MNKFSSNIDYLRQYVNGELTPTEMYEIERAMHDDEMLADIIEGLEFEKNQKIASPVAKIRSNIKTRTSKDEQHEKVFPFKKLLIAASIIAILSFGAIYLFNPPGETVDFAVNESDIDPKITTAPPIVENAVPDSTIIAFSEKEVIDEENLPTIVGKKSQPKKSAVESTPQKKLMVYSAKPKMQVIIEGPKYLNKQQEEIIAGYGSSYIAPPQSELISARVGAAQQPKSAITSIAKTQADLQKLDLDPQTKANLSTILSRQAMDNNAEIKEKQADLSSISDVLINGNALANKNNADSRIIHSSESLGVIGAKTIQNGNPTVGWAKFNDYIKEQLQKKGFSSYNVNISFDLDEAMRPTHIDIKTTSNPKLNTAIIELLKLGPTWENKDPNHPIFIRINSEKINHK